MCEQKVELGDTDSHKETSPNLGEIRDKLYEELNKFRVCLYFNGAIQITMRVYAVYYNKNVDNKLVYLRNSVK